MKSIHGHRGGGKRSKEYITWDKMMQRCYNKNSSNYKHYGGKGVSVCERWHKFENFLEDVGFAPSPNHSLDRYPDNKGNYEPNNFRWATFEEQQRNRTDNRHIEAFGETKTMAEWCDLSTIPKTTIHKRLGMGWTPEEAFTRPSRKMNRVVRK